MNADTYKRVRGSSPLTKEQQDWYVEHFGARYLVVQEQPQNLPRRARRARRKDDLG